MWVPPFLGGTLTRLLNWADLSNCGERTANRGGSKGDDRVATFPEKKCVPHKTGSKSR